MFNDIISKIFGTMVIIFLIICGYADYKYSVEAIKQKFRIENAEHIYYTNEYTIDSGCIKFNSYASSGTIRLCGTYSIYGN